MNRFRKIAFICLLAILVLGLGVSYCFVRFSKSCHPVPFSIQAENDLLAITTQLRTYELYSLRLPTTEQGLKALIEKPTVPPIPRRWEQLMEKFPTDPWGNPYQYRLNSQNNPPTFELFSFGPDGKPNDDIYLKE
jgi:type II secretion system protein G